jgi:hypothetical protein
VVSVISRGTVLPRTRRQASLSSGLNTCRSSSRCTQFVGCNQTRLDQLDHVYVYRRYVAAARVLSRAAWLRALAMPTGRRRAVIEPPQAERRDRPEQTSLGGGPHVTVRATPNQQQFVGSPPADFQFHDARFKIARDDPRARERRKYRAARGRTGGARRHRQGINKGPAAMGAARRPAHAHHAGVAGIESQTAA